MFKKVLLEIEAQFKNISIRNDFEGNDPENKIAAERRFPAGISLMYG
jgi:hypothetical protein